MRVVFVRKMWFFGSVFCYVYMYEFWVLLLVLLLRKYRCCLWDCVDGNLWNCGGFCMSFWFGMLDKNLRMFFLDRFFNVFYVGFLIRWFINCFLSFLFLDLIIWSLCFSFFFVDWNFFVNLVFNFFEIFEIFLVL